MSHLQDVDATARTPNSVHNSVDHSSDNDQVEPVSEMMNDEHNSEDEQVMFKHN